MRLRREWVLPALLTLTVMLASCGGGPANNTPAPVNNTVVNNTPAPAPPAATKGDAAAGKTVYENECAKCHDVDGTGKTRSGRMFNTPDLHDLLDRRTDEQLVNNITNGVGKMDAFGTKLSSGDIQNVVAYLRQLITQH